MAERDPYRIWEVTGVWASAAATAGAVIVSLWLASRQGVPQLRVRADRWKLISGVPKGTGSVKPEDFPDTLLVEVANTGEIVARIISVWWVIKIPWFLRLVGVRARGGLIQNAPEPHERSHGLPAVLAPSETLQWALDYQYLHREIAEKLLADSPFWRVRLRYLRIGVNTSVGRSVTGEVGLSLREGLKAHCRQVRADRLTQQAIPGRLKTAGSPLEGNMHTRPVAVTVGIEIPGNFPLAEYNAVHQRLAPLQPSAPVPFRHYAGAWNTVAFRYRTAVEADVYFRSSLSASDAEGRDAQELGLFNFFTSAVATLDSLAYGLHAIGAMVKGSSFSLEAKALLTTIPSVAAAYRTAFKGDPLELALNGIAIDPTFIELSEIRNALSHRSASTRTIEFTSGRAPPPAAPVWRFEHLQLKNGTGSLVIDETTTTKYLDWLSGQLRNVLSVAEPFVSARLSDRR